MKESESLAYLIPSVAVLVVSFENDDPFARLKRQFVLILGVERVQCVHHIRHL